MKKILLPCFTLLLLIACNEGNKTSTTSATKEMIVDKSKDSWGGDIVLHIQQANKISPEITAYKITSLYQGKPVGFNIVVTQPAKKNLFVDKGITFYSLKDTSNNFLNALAAIYGVKGNVIFKDSLTITYADLAAGINPGKPGNVIAAQKKLFFETDDDNPELFLNIDETAGTISFPEKDSSYREGIIKALSKKSK